MPFRNNIASVNGTLIAPGLQSPDFNFVSSPFNITGWGIQNNPSRIAAQTLYAANAYIRVRAISGTPVRTVSLADLMTLETTLNGATYTMDSSISPFAITTTYQWLTGSAIRINIPPLLQTQYASSFIRFWSVRAYFDTQRVSASTNSFVGRIGYRTSLAPSTWSAVSTTNQAVCNAKFIGARQASSCEVLISTATQPSGQQDLAIPDGATWIEVAQGGYCSANSVVSLNNAGTHIAVTASPVFMNMSLI